jgi:hypothetical protein
VLLDEGSRINIIIKPLKLRLGFPKLKPIPYNLKMVDQTTTKLVGLIYLKIYAHGILYITTFIVLQNSVIDYSYFMLLGRPWSTDAKMAHGWGSNTATI